MADVRVEQGSAFLAQCIEGARSRVVLVSYMLTSLSIVRALCRAAASGRSVSVLTLPPDMVRSSDSAAVDRVQAFHEELKSRARLDHADLEIGDPRRTTSSQSDVRSGESVGRKWYALHAKFLVADDTVVMTSANCGHEFLGRGAERTAGDEAQWEMHWSCTDRSLAEQYVQWYERLRRDLCAMGSDSLWREVSEAVSEGRERASLIQEGVNSYRLTDYPSSYVGAHRFHRGRHSELVVFPFMASARQYFSDVIRDAKARVWLCAETLTDADTLELVLRIAATNPQYSVRLLTGPIAAITEPGLKARVRSQFLPAATAMGNFEWRELRRLHAKAWVTERAAAIGSVNPNKMNLGFAPRRGYWRSSVEAMHVVSEEPEIAAVAEAFGELWGRAEPAPGWDDVDWYANALAGRAVPKGVLARVHDDVRAQRQALYGAIGDAVRRHLGQGALDE